MSLGEQLRAARERRNRNLSQIAADLRISASHLEAIERDDLRSLPGGFFTRSFVRQYAEAVGLDAGKLETELDRMLADEQTPLVPGEEPRKQESTDLPPLPRYARRRPQRRRVLSALAALVVVIAACAAVYRYWMNDESAVLTSVPDVVKEPVTPAAVEERSVVASAQPARQRPEGPLWLQIEAEEEVWVEITSGDKTLFSGLLRPSESKELTGLEEARLVIGNAGGLRVSWNGKPVGPIGPSGQVRVVKVTPDGAEIKRLRPASRKPEGEDELSRGV